MKAMDFFEAAQRQMRLIGLAMRYLAKDYPPHKQEAKFEIVGALLDQAWQYDDPIGLGHE